MRYLPLGSTNEIAASCHYLEVAGTGLILDAGMDPERDGVEALPAFEQLRGRPVDHVVVTHAHHDHLGALPVLVTHRPDVRIHMTRPTQLLADILLPHSARLQRKRLREGSSTFEPVFDLATAEALTYLYEGHLLDTNFDLTGPQTTPGVKITGRLYHAGHVLGAAGLLLEINGKAAPRRIFYTADTNLRPQAIEPGAEYPEGPIDVLFLEATLGADPDAEQTSRAQTERAFAEALNRTLARGGVCLIPSFALGRAQEMLALIDRFKRRGWLPKDVPVFTAGTMRALSGVYDQTRTMSPRMDPDFEVYGVEQQRLPRNADRSPEAFEQPAIHIAASGMLFEKTLSNEIARRLLESEKHGIFFVGFVKEGSPGDRLLKAAEQGAGTPVQLDREYPAQAIRCEVGRYRFSGHANRRDLLDLVGRLKPKKVVLVHGDADAKTWMRDNIAFFYPKTEIVLPTTGQEIEV